MKFPFAKHSFHKTSLHFFYYSVTIDDKDNTVSTMIVKQDQFLTMFHVANLHGHGCGVENGLLQRENRNMEI